MSVQQAEADKAAMRARLSEQLNSILQTRDSARGLIVSMSDVLFDTAKYSLKPGAREKLAKVAGILLAYPGLNIEVGGYTDNVGSDAMNQTLSENRAGSVRDYLVQQGVAANSVSAKGFGETLPVASNDNSAGRQQNRRVELLVSGDSHWQPGQRDNRKLAVEQATCSPVTKVVTYESTSNHQHRHPVGASRNRCSCVRTAGAARRKAGPSRSTTEQTPASQAQRRACSAITAVKPKTTAGAATAAARPKQAATACSATTAAGPQQATAAAGPEQAAEPGNSGAMQQPQRAQQQPRVQQSAWQQHRAQNWQSDHRNWQQRGGYHGYRIPDDRFRGYFGPSHGFRIYGLPFMVVSGYPRFQYQGYWISLVDPWPEYWGNDWYDNDDVYVAYVDNGYYLYNNRYPNVGIAVNISF